MEDVRGPPPAYGGPTGSRQPEATTSAVVNESMFETGTVAPTTLTSAVPGKVSRTGGQVSTLAGTTPTSESEQSTPGGQSHTIAEETTTDGPGGVEETSGEAATAATQPPEGTGKHPEPEPEPPAEFVDTPFDAHLIKMLGELEALSWNDVLSKAGAASGGAMSAVSPSARESREDLIFEGKVRLAQRALTVGFNIVEMDDDGACLFRAVSFQLYREESFHMAVRRKAIAEIKTNLELYQSYLGLDDSDMASYVERMSEPTEWGDEIMLRAVCDAYGAVVHVIKSNPDPEPWYMRYSPEQSKTKKNLFVSYIDPVHYNSIVHTSDPHPRNKDVVIPELPPEGQPGQSGVTTEELVRQMEEENAREAEQLRHDEEMAQKFAAELAVQDELEEQERQRVADEEYAKQLQQEEHARRASHASAAQNPLPPNWEQRLARGTNKIFYKNVLTGEKQWQLPAPVPAVVCPLCSSTNYPAATKFTCGACKATLVRK